MKNTAYTQGKAHIDSLRKHGAKLIDLETGETREVPADFLRTVMHWLKQNHAQAVTCSIIPFDGAEAYGEFGLRITEDGHVDSGSMESLKNL